MHFLHLQIARPLLEKTFCLKIQSRKVFAHRYYIVGKYKLLYNEMTKMFICCFRESFETVLNKAESLLANVSDNFWSFLHLVYIRLNFLSNNFRHTATTTMRVYNTFNKETMQHWLIIMTPITLTFSNWKEPMLCFENITTRPYPPFFRWVSCMYWSITLNLWIQCSNC